MKTDILLLGGVMQKAQDIYWKLFKIDIVSQLTLSSVALTIFRVKYYNQDNWPIHIPNRNEDTFIRRGFYGGHADAYKPIGSNLYIYDINSLYPFVMKTFPMPGGKPVWHRDLRGIDINNLFGFIEAYVECPNTIKRPFLPYRDEKTKSLLFPTEKDDYWDPPRISAVQLSAAVTACSRIYMYPYISRDDCYYTDTDSIVIGKPLPEEDVSSTELGH
ncbi:DNA-directed DNA-polymerase, family B, mitochondria/virus [Sesbania bispinosa]|nr:DNA-directed DNA-polymerase, family B, mitochondria/virus [Sesbania bispinosa]